MTYDPDSEVLFTGSLPAPPSGDGAAPRRRRARRTMLMNDALVQAITSAAGDDFYVFDTECRSLAVRARNGLSSYYFYPESQPGQKKQIGSVCSMTCDEARREARRRWDIIFNAPDDEWQPRLRDLPFGEVFARDRAYAGANAREIRFQRLVREHILPQFEARPISKITRRELCNVIDSLARKQPGQANLLQNQLKAFFNRCAYKNILDANPLARRAAPSNRGRPTTLLPATDLALIFFAARELAAPWRTMIPLLILTGARVVDVRHLSQDRIDWQNGTYASQTNLRAPWLSWNPLSALALEILTEAAPQAGRLFPSPRHNAKAPIELRPTVLAEVQKRSQTSDWSWCDVSRSVAAQLRALDAAGAGIGVTAIDRERSLLNAWANSLPHNLDKALATRASDDAIEL